MVLIINSDIILIPEDIELHFTGKKNYLNSSLKLRSINE
jgi:hypothetical protein